MSSLSKLKILNHNNILYGKTQLLHGGQSLNSLFVIFQGNGKVEYITVADDINLRSYFFPFFHNAGTLSKLL